MALAFPNANALIMVVDNDQIWYRRGTKSNMVIVRFAKFGIWYINMMTSKKNIETMIHISIFTLFRMTNPLNRMSKDWVWWPKPVPNSINTHLTLFRVTLHYTTISTIFRGQPWVLALVNICDESFFITSQYNTPSHVLLFSGLCCFTSYFTNFKINVLPLTTTLVDFLVYPIEFYVGFIPWQKVL